MGEGLIEALLATRYCKAKEMAPSEEVFRPCAQFRGIG